MFDLFTARSSCFSMYLYGHHTFVLEKCWEFQATSPLKPLGQCCSNFMWSLLRLREQKIAIMVGVHWPRWPPCPYMVKTFKNLLITETCLYNFDPLKPHFYTVKLGFTGVYIIFLISVQNIDCGYSLELPHQGSSKEYPQSMFWAEIYKISEFFIWKFSFFGGKIFSIFE